MRIPETIIIQGYTGADSKEIGTIDDIRAKLIALEKERHPSGYPSEEVQDQTRVHLFDDVVSAWHVAAYHNGMIPLLRSYCTAVRKTIMAARDADEAYVELSKRTTTAWHAAHHRYIVALDIR